MSPSKCLIHCRGSYGMRYLSNSKTYFPLGTKGKLLLGKILLLLKDELSTASTYTDVLMTH